MHYNNREEMLKEGFTAKMADYWLSCIELEKKQSGIYDSKYMRWAHENGFLVAHAYAYNLNDDNKNYYLSDYDYYKMWPINNWTRIWINDKLTLKYVMNNALFSNYMPRYYYYSVPNKGICSLMDNPNIKGEQGFLDLLRTEGAFACKPNNGTESRGFFKLEYSNGSFSINGTEVEKEDIIHFIDTHPNYLYTEYLYPDTFFSGYSTLVHTLRIMLVKEYAKPPVIAGIYLRLPVGENHAANYNYSYGQDGSFNLYVFPDIETGHFDCGYKVYANHVEKTFSHPQTGKELNGILPNFKLLKDFVCMLSKYLGSLEFMGLDMAATPSGYKLMEINSHPGISNHQIMMPFFKNSYLKGYFESKIDTIDNLSDKEKLQRIGIIR